LAAVTCRERKVLEDGWQGIVATGDRRQRVVDDDLDIPKIEAM
jgi:hypothetical protein